MRFICHILCLGLLTTAEAFTLSSPERSARLVLAPGEATCVRLAVQDLASDVRKITGRPLEIVDGGAPQAGDVWVRTTGTGPWESSLPPEQVAGIISISGIADGTIDRKAHPGRYRHMTKPYDPQTLIRKGAGPRILLTHADHDPVVPIESAQSFLKAYKAAGNPAELFCYPENAEPNTGSHRIWRAGSDPHRLLVCLEDAIRKFCKK